MGHGLLRFSQQAEKARIHVSTSFDNNNKLNCEITNLDSEAQLLNQEVVLIQKSDKDYLYITGRINEDVKPGSKVLSLNITKACWFVRKEIGKVSWLRQKYYYENPELKLDLAS